MSLPLKKSTWMLISLYLLISAFIFEIFIANQFYPYVYEYIEDNNVFSVRDGTGQLVWGPYEANPNELAHDSQLMIVLLVPSISRTLLNGSFVLLTLPLAIKTAIDKPSFWNKLNLVGLSLLLAFLTYLNVSYVIDLQPYLEH